MRIFKRCLVLTGMLSLSLLLPNAALAKWLEADRVGDTVYFFPEDSFVVNRYDLANQIWLANLVLPAHTGYPRAALVDADGIYVAIGKNCYRYDLLGQNEILLCETPEPVDQILADHEILLLNRFREYPPEVTTIKKASNEVVETVLLTQPIREGVLFASSRKLAGYDASYFDWITYSAEGVITGFYHDFLSLTLSHLFAYPGGERLFTGQAQVFDLGTQSFVAKFVGAAWFDDLAFYQTDTPVFLKGNEVQAYSRAGSVLGRAAVHGNASRVFVRNDRIFAFSDPGTDGGPGVSVALASDLNLPATDGPIPSEDRIPRFDMVFTGADGMVYGVQNICRTVFRWNPATQRYLTSLPLSEIPSSSVYDAGSNRLYLSNESGQVTKIDLSSPAKAEEPFCDLQFKPTALQCIGSNLFVFRSTATDSWESSGTAYLVSASGTIVDQVELDVRTQAAFAWSQRTGRLFYVDGGIVGSLAIQTSGSQSGMFGEAVEDYISYQSSAFLSASPDGKWLLRGDGLLLDPLKLKPKGKLAVPGNRYGSIRGAVWNGGTVTVTCAVTRGDNNTSQLRAYRVSDRTLTKSASLPGEPISLVQCGNSLVLANACPTEIRDAWFGDEVFIPEVSNLNLLNYKLRTIVPPEIEAPRAPSATYEYDYISTMTSSIRLNWTDVSGGRLYQVQRSIDSGSFATIGTTTGNSLEYLDSHCPKSASKVAYRLIARSGKKTSLPGPATQLWLSGLLAPSQLEAFYVSSTAVGIRWKDVANETRYTIERYYRVSNSWETIGERNEDICEFWDEAILPGEMAEYRVHANGFGYSYSGYSEVLQVTVPKN